MRCVKHNLTLEWPLDIQILSSKQVNCMKANATAEMLLLCDSIFTSSARTRLQHWSLKSKQRQSGMAETEESTMEENNVASNFTSDTDTETEPQKIRCWKGGPEFHRLALVWV